MIQTVTVIILLFIVVSGMLPAVMSNDPAIVQKAADKTIERVINFTTDRIVDEAKSLPFKVLIDTTTESEK